MRSASTTEDKSVCDHDHGLACGKLRKCLLYLPNLNRRIETAFPILNAEIKRNIIDILNIQLQDNVKACLIDEHLHNNFKRDGNPVKVRAQLAVYEYLKNKI